LVKYVSANYAAGFGGLEIGAHLGQGIRTRSSSATLPPFPFPPSHSHTGPSRLGPWQSQPSPRTSVSAERYNAASEKNTAAHLLIPTRSTPRQRFLLDRPDCGSALDDDADEVPGF
jgi:hypothetical protein